MRVAIQVSELRYATEDGVLVLDGVSFGLPGDGFVFVVGPPSSGKTLLLELILREKFPSGGQILVLGRNMARLSPTRARALRRRIGYMPEEPVILEGRTVRGNLEFKLRALGISSREAREHLARALELAGLKGEEGRRASSLGALGQRRLLLALALCPEPAILLADDPFRGLEPGEQDELVALLQGVHEVGVAVLATCRDGSIPARHGFPPKDRAPLLKYTVHLQPERAR
ncbi:MAG: ATP-binding cassette domain-containing protein [Candidatus Bipolaricaulota bacterium]|nr:ATP-binding cassette domain-containing protein [Candidatus Bipolaricaulota bacterium]